MRTNLSGCDSRTVTDVTPQQQNTVIIWQARELLTELLQRHEIMQDVGDCRRVVVRAQTTTKSLNNSTDNTTRNSEMCSFYCALHDNDPSKILPYNEQLRCT